MPKAPNTPCKIHYIGLTSKAFESLEKHRGYMHRSAFINTAMEVMDEDTCKKIREFYGKNTILQKIEKVRGGEINDRQHDHCCQGVYRAWLGRSSAIKTK